MRALGSLPLCTEDILNVMLFTLHPIPVRVWEPILHSLIVTCVECMDTLKNSAAHYFQTIFMAAFAA